MKQKVNLKDCGLFVTANKNGKNSIYIIGVIYKIIYYVEKIICTWHGYNHGVRNHDVCFRCRTG